jgi:hypothetical protein
MSWLVAVFLLLSGCAGREVREVDDGFEKPVSFSILEDYDKDESLRQVEADFLLFKELGITTWRGSFGWDDYEPAPGAYDFEWLHRFAELARDHGIALRPYIAYTPAWAAKPGGQDNAVWNNPPADVTVWSRFVARLAYAMKRHTNILSFEIYNEQNSPMWWDGSVEEYARVLESGSEAIRGAGGDDKVLLGGITFPDIDWLDETCALVDGRQVFDVLPIHVYAETWPREQAVEHVLNHSGFFHDEFLPEADRSCGRKPVWINETGYATTPGIRTERDQANWWARAIATFVADPRVEHIGVYEIKDRPRTADVIGEPENHFLGLTYPDRRRKLAFHTVKRLVALLDTGMITVADERLSVEVLAGREGALYRHVFIRPDGHQVLFLWDRSGNPRVRVRLPHAGAQAIEYALDGTGTPYPHLKGRYLHDIQLTSGEVRMFEILPPNASALTGIVGEMAPPLFTANPRVFP